MMKYIIIIFLTALNCKQSIPLRVNPTPLIYKNTLASAGVSIVNPNIRYEPAYVRINYPMGDVDPTTGVCTDVIIRAYRKVGFDLQQKVYEYRLAQGLPTNQSIDHRRVPNLMQYFKAMGAEVTGEFRPGDVVAWKLFGGANHIGLVVNQRSDDNYRWMVVHNIGRGQIVEDILYNYGIIGHYRYN